MAKAFSTADIKARLSEMIGKVTYGRERLIVLRRGKPVAALVSLQDLQRLEALDGPTWTRSSTKFTPTGPRRQVVRLNCEFRPRY
jgi:prevent-host-death family protein